jgi:hypothetical protein
MFLKLYLYNIMYLIETFENFVEMYTKDITIDSPKIDLNLKYNNVTRFLRKQARKFIPLLKRLNFNQVNIVTISLLFNAFALYNIINREFEIFILLLLTSYFVDIIYEVYIEEHKINTKFSIKYYNITEWLKMVFVSVFIYILYFKKISPSLIILVFLLTLVNNLHYSIEREIEDKNYKSIWNKIIKNKDEKKLLKYTKNFDEIMTIIYFILIIIYIHYS